MHIIIAEENQIKAIVDMSVRAFETDVNVGGTKGDCPPGYDSVEWHKQMAQEGHLYQAMIGKILWEQPSYSRMKQTILCTLAGFLLTASIIEKGMEFVSWSA